MQRGTALVTGSTQGIGRAVAKRLAADGMNVVVCGRSQERGEAVAEDIRNDGGRAIYTRCDVGVESEIVSAIEATVDEFGGLTTLVNNAAPMIQVSTGRDNTVVNLATSDWDEILRIGLSSVFWCSKYAIPHMIDAGGGSVVNITTVSALRGEAGLDAYSAAKGAMVSLTRSMAVEFGGQGVRVNAIAPGFIPGDLPATRAMTEHPVMSQIFRSAQLLDGWGRPDDIAAAVAWITSDQARFVTGVVLPVDGGATAYSRMPNTQSPAWQEAIASIRAA
jgi:NAD(P)-dependent dehydrogenase (short-subunit alcohol dehydrogenase family)